MKGSWDLAHSIVLKLAHVVSYFEIDPYISKRLLPIHIFYCCFQFVFFFFSSCVAFPPVPIALHFQWYPAYHIISFGTQGYKKEEFQEVLTASFSSAKVRKILSAGIFHYSPPKKQLLSPLCWHPARRTKMPS